MTQVKNTCTRIREIKFVPKFALCKFTIPAAILMVPFRRNEDLDKSVSIGHNTAGLAREICSFLRHLQGKDIHVWW